MTSASAPAISTMPGLSAAIASAIAVAGVGSATLPMYDLGPLAGHMAFHIVTMNVAAPLLAVLLARLRHSDTRADTLWAAAGLQIILLWFWHMPAWQLLAHTMGGALLMHMSLMTAAIWFWKSLISLRRVNAWHGVLALLITGKMACLLAGLLVFAPRPLYSGHLPTIDSMLEDQHLAGLLMLVACPLSYLLAGVLLTTRILGIGRGTVPQSTSI